MYSIRKLYRYEQEQLASLGHDVFSRTFFDQTMLSFMSRLGDLYVARYKKANRKDLLALYVSGFKAILAIGVSLSCKDDLREPEINEKREDEIRLFYEMYEKSLVLSYTLKDSAFYSLLGTYLNFGQTLGINFDDIMYVYRTQEEK